MQFILSIARYCFSVLNLFLGHIAMHNNGSMRPFATYTCIAWSVCLPVFVPACLLVTNVRPTNGNMQTQNENYCKRLYGTHSPHLRANEELFAAGKHFVESPCCRIRSNTFIMVPRYRTVRHDRMLCGDAHCRALIEASGVADNLV